jgi:hypothetical protein
MKARLQAGLMIGFTAAADAAEPIEYLEYLAPTDLAKARAWLAAAPERM